ncbi:MAG: calcium-translocating P-type ATPase, PMCA-type [Bacteroidales bacterium]|nr:calcium-translocating P-type ATPase, PMCA-type [Bacteroidales bacterium]
MDQTHHYTGLTDAQVIESREKNGINVLTPPKRESLWKKFIDCFSDPLIRILLIALLLSIGISIYQFGWGGDDASVFFEPAGILIAVLLATMVGFFLELSNEKTFQSLNEVNDETLVKVIRNGNVCQVQRKEIVVDDIVLLEIGEEVPADCEVLESFNLIMNESSLTGEPQCNKTTDPAHFDKDATYPSNHILKGTTIIEGYCTAKVLRVGDRTECGKVFTAAQVEEGDPTPLSKKLEWLSKIITTASYIIAGLIIVGRLIVYFVQGDANFAETEGIVSFIKYVLDTIMIAVTLIVVAVPEGLPMSVTLSLAFSMKRLMKQNTLPRTMHSCETMGATSVICTDKTGTLTQNQMKIHDTSFESLEGQKLGDDKTSRLLAECIAMDTSANLDMSNPEKAKTVGSPTEGAVLLWLNDFGINYRQIRESTEIIDRIPFSTKNKYMATIVKSNVVEGNILYVIGAPDIIMSYCNLTESDKAKYEAKLAEYQSKAMRTLGFASLQVTDNQEVFEDGKLKANGLQMLGVVAISDPIRPDVPDAIRECLNAGITVKIVTGDAPGTAKEIGRQLGLWTEEDTDANILLGQDIAEMTDEQLSAVIADVKIISRARPNDKERVVKMLKNLGKVAAVTGDGTNDAPALNAADVGLSMGDGTAVAKEASDMTILDNSFSTIANAVMWGRSLYKNIQRFIMFQMTINVAACLIVLFGAFLGTESPLTVTQMLWVNLIMDTFAALALASLPPSKEVMKEKPRMTTDAIISKKMASRIFGVGGLFFVILLGILLLFQHNDITSLTDINFTWGEDNGLSPYELSLFFTIFVMLQFWNMFNAKAFMTGKSAFSGLLSCKWFLIIALVIFLGQILIVEVGGQMFNVCHLELLDWLIIVGATSIVLWIGEIARMICKR